MTRINCVNAGNKLGTVQPGLLGHTGFQDLDVFSCSALEVYPSLELLQI